VKLKEQTSKYLQNVQKDGQGQIKRIQQEADNQKQMVNTQFVGIINSVLTTIIAEKELDPNTKWTFSEDYTEVIGAVEKKKEAKPKEKKPSLGKFLSGKDKK